MRWVVLAVAVVACKDREAPKSAEPPAKSAAVTAPVPARPVLPAPEADANTMPLTVDQAFSAQPVDASWKAATERELHQRLAHLSRPPSELECRRSQCKLTFVGDQPQLVKVMDELENEHALAGIAQSVMLTAVEPRPDGTLALHAYARFDRPQPEN